MKRILWLVTTLLSLFFVLSLALVFVLFVVPLDLDATPYKHRIFSLLEGRTGYRVTLGGDLSLRLGPQLRIQADGLLVENLGLAEDRELLSAKRAGVEVDTLALLKGRFLPLDLVLADAKIKVRREGDRRLNWAMRHGGGAGTESTGGFPVVFEAHALTLGLTMVELSYVDRISGASYEGVLKRGRVDPSKTGLRLDIDGTVGGSLLRLKGGTASLSHLLDLERSVPLDLEGQLLGLEFSAKGQVVNPYAEVEVDASLSLRAKDLKALAPFIGDALAAMGPLKLDTKIKGGAKAISIDPFELTLGPQRVTGSTKVDLSGLRPRVELVGRMEEVDLTPFLGWLKDEKGKDAEEGEAFSRDELQWDWMDSADIVAKVEVTDLLVPKLAVTDLALDLHLQDRHLTMTAGGKAKGGRSVHAEWSLEVNKASPTAEIRFKGDKLLLEPLIANTGAKGLIRGEIDVKAELSATGRSQAAMVASTTGRVLLLVEGAEADVDDLDHTIGGSSALLMQLVTPRDKLAKINCGVFAARFAGGKAEVRGVTDTAHAIVVGYGEVDLETGQLNVRVDPKGKGVTLSLATPVVVEGSWRDPQYRVLKGELLGTLTDLTTRAALPPLLLLDAFGDAVAENPCVAFTVGKVPDKRLFKPVAAIAGETDQAARGVGTTVVEGAGAVVGGIGGAVLEGGAAVLKEIGNVFTGAAGGTGKSEAEGVADDSSKRLGGAAEPAIKAPEQEENLFLQ